MVSTCTTCCGVYSPPPLLISSTFNADTQDKREKWMKTRILLSRNILTGIRDQRPYSSTEYSTLICCDWTLDSTAAMGNCLIPDLRSTKWFSCALTLIKSTQILHPVFSHNPHCSAQKSVKLSVVIPHACVPSYLLSHPSHTMYTIRILHTLLHGTWEEKGSRNKKMK